MNLSSLHKDPTLLIALELSPKDLLNLCKSSKRFNDLICNNDNFWRMKLVRDFNFTNFTKVENLTPKQIYKQLYDNCKKFIPAYLVDDIDTQVVKIYSLMHSYDFNLSRFLLDKITGNPVFMMRSEGIEYLRLSEPNWTNYTHAFNNLPIEQAKRGLINILKKINTTDMKNIYKKILEGFINETIPLNVTFRDICKYIGPFLI